MGPFYRMGVFVLANKRSAFRIRLKMKRPAKPWLTWQDGFGR
jgi:hypothetical protein